MRQKTDRQITVEGKKIKVSNNTLMFTKIKVGVELDINEYL